MSMAAPISIIMFSMSPYTEWAISKKANRNYHIMRGLEHDPRVSSLITVDFLPHTLKRAVREYVDARKLRAFGPQVWRSATSSCYKVSEKLSVLSTVSPVFSQRLFRAEIRSLVRRLSLHQPTVVWSYTPLYTSYFDALPSALRVFDAVDNWAEHPAYASMQERLRENYEIISKTADLIFAVTPYVVEKLFSRSAHAEWVPNGVDVDFYARPQAEPDDLMRIPHPRIGYSGVIQSRIDFTLLQELVSLSPDMHFVFVGPVWPDAKVGELKRSKNVHFLGSKPFDMLPAYLQGFDVGIIPHAHGEFVKSMNPMKLYEYLAAGLPVVMTPVPGAEPFQEVVHIANDATAFGRAVQSALQEHESSDRERRMQSVQQHTWASRVNTMLSRVYSRLSGA